MNVILRLVLMLVMPVLAGGFYLAFDFWNVNRMAKYGDGDGVTVGEYISGWVSFGSAMNEDTAAGKGVALPTELLAMLPKAPEGWTVAPSAATDLDDYLPKGTDKKVKKYVKAVVADRSGRGLAQARQTYRNGTDIVVFELVRYPDIIFTSFAAMDMKFTLQMTGTEFQGRSFMTVRGMEIKEDVLPGDVGLRYFVGDISDQIWLRVVTSETMTDEGLLRFFETLHVPAMAADVIEKQEGMGELPLIVLASVIDDQTRAALETEQAEQTTRLAEERAAKEAEQKAEEQAAAEAAQGEDDGSMFSGVTESIFGGGDSADTPLADRQSRQEALVEAAQSGDAAAVGALAAMEFDAIAKEMGQAGAEGASPPTGAAAFGGTKKGGKSTIKVGTGGCGDRAGGGKFCTVGN
jgi:hypothetical protein